MLDLALLFKLIGSDCYGYRTFRPQLPGISRWSLPFWLAVTTVIGTTLWLVHDLGAPRLERDLLSAPEPNPTIAPSPGSWLRGRPSVPACAIRPPC